jgi:uncharacterized protein YbbC (DUF1343 family)
MRPHHLSLLGLLAGAGPLAAQVRPGIEVLLADSIRLVAGKRVALLTNQTGVDRQGRRDVDLLRATPSVEVRLLFSPEHGFRGAEDRPGLPDGVDSVTGLPIYSLYSGARAPDFAALDGVDVLLVDLQDVGARYYTYPATAVVLMREAARRGKRVVVLDRPNPIGGDVVQGNVRARPGPPDLVSLDFLPWPMRHGMTLGELLRMANAVYAVHADLTVVPAAGWRRPQYYDETGLPWVKPSPNMPDLESAIHYPGTCLFEATNLSVGRGTAAAFQVIGAPWLDTPALLRHLKGAGSREQGALTGVAIDTATFTPRSPTDGKYDGVALRGVRLRVTDRRRYDPAATAVALLAAIHAVQRDSLRFNAERFDQLAAGAELRRAIVAGRSRAAIVRGWRPALARFRRARAEYLVY